MTRRTSLQYSYGSGLNSYTSTGIVTAYPPSADFCLGGGDGNFVEFPHNFMAKRLLPIKRENDFSGSYHRLSHPHLTFSSAMLHLTSNKQHRNSQPSLPTTSHHFDNNKGERPPAMRHVPSHPALNLYAKRFSMSNGSIAPSPPYLHSHGGYSTNYLNSTNATPMYTPVHSKNNSPSGFRKFPKASEKRILKRHPQSDLAFRFQRHVERQINEGTETQPEESKVVDPVYLALKQATNRYGSRRGSSAHNFDSASPSPRNLSQVSLQDSGYVETTGSRGQLLGSTPMLNNVGATLLNRRRPPKLNKQMKSLSLDCAETPNNPNTMQSQFAPNIPLRRSKGYANSGETSDWERSVSPVVTHSPRRLPSTPTTSSSPVLRITHVVIHEYNNSEFILYLGDRMVIVDNGDPDWLHGFKASDRTARLLTFPSTCVAALAQGEQPMKLLQNVNLVESRMRFYRDQVVFAQPNSMREDRVLVRSERGKMAECPLMFLALL